MLYYKSFPRCYIETKWQRSHNWHTNAISMAILSCFLNSYLMIFDRPSNTLKRALLLCIMRKRCLDVFIRSVAYQRLYRKISKGSTEAMTEVVKLLGTKQQAAADLQLRLPGKEVCIHLSCGYQPISPCTVVLFVLSWSGSLLLFHLGIFRYFNDPMSSASMSCQLP